MAAVSVAMTVAGCDSASARSSVNVRNFGAKGDGAHDDSKAITSAVAALKPGDSLYFPRGSYRFAQREPVLGAAIAITGLSNVDIEFDNGAELVMDNLDDDGAGTSHGIVVRGPASGVSLRNVKVRWATQPKLRSRGDGIRIVGYPTAVPTDPGVSRSITGVSISNCEIIGCPQAGVIMMGVSDITVSLLRVRDSMADGLHFNACRRGTIADYTATNVGDDGLALVTYYDDAFRFDTESETFAFPNLTDWSNSEFRVQNVLTTGGHANGVRLAGVNRAILSGITVRGHDNGSGVIIDSATKRSDAGWYYVASRGVRLEDVLVERCETGVQVLARPVHAVDTRFTAFDVDVSSATIRGCSNWSLRAESLTSRLVSGLHVGSVTAESQSTEDGKGGIGLQNTLGVTMGTVWVRHEHPVAALVAVNARRLNVGTFRATIVGAADARAAEPCAVLVSSEGRIDLVDVSWPDAPSSWTAVQIQAFADCADTTSPESILVKLGRAIVDPPSVSRPVEIC